MADALNEFGVQEWWLELGWGMCHSEAIMNSLMRVAFFVVAGYLISVCGAGAQTGSETNADISVLEKTTWKDRFLIHADAGYRQSLWYPGGIRSDLILFDTEGLESYDAGVLLAYRNIPFFFYHNEGPVRDDPEQAALFALHEENEAALKKIRLGVLLSCLERAYSITNPVMTMLAGLQYVHSEETYFGNAEAQQAFAYIDSRDQVTFAEDGSSWVHDYTMVEEGDALAFRTDFVDDEVTVTLPMEFKRWKFRGKAGYFQCSWKRPSDLNRWVMVEEGTPILYKTTFKAKGMVVGLLSDLLEDEESGVEWALTGRWGFEHELSNIMHDDIEVEGDEDLMFASGLVEAWYHWKFGERKQFQISLGGAWDRRVFATEFHWARGTWEADTLYRLSCNIGMQL